MTETLANGYSSESTERELSNEYQHDRVYMIFKNLCILVLWMKVSLALEGLIDKLRCVKRYKMKVFRSIHFTNRPFTTVLLTEIHGYYTVISFPGSAQ